MTNRKGRETRSLVVNFQTLHIYRFVSLKINNKMKVIVAFALSMNRKASAHIYDRYLYVLVGL